MNNNRLIINLSSEEAEIAVLSKNKQVESLDLMINGISKGSVIDNDSFLSSFQDPKFLRIINTYDFEDILVGISPSVISTATEKNTIFDSQQVKAINEDDTSLMQHELSEIKDDITLIHSYTLGFILDGKDIVSNPLGMHARKFETYKLKVFVESNISKALKNLLDDIGFNCPLSIVSNTLAKSLILVDEENRDFGCYYLNVGIDVTELSIIHKNKVIYMGAIPVGQHNFINDIALTLNINKKDSKILVDKFGTITPELIKDKETINITTKTGQEERISNKKIGAIMRERAHELLNIAKKYFEENTNNKLSINRLVISGPGTKYEGFESLSKYIFQFFVYSKNKENIVSNDMFCLSNFDRNFKDLRLNIEQLSKKKFIEKEIEKNTTAMKDKIKKIFNFSLGG
ncbi:MAG: cell division FtsA domain-containing protein [Chloroflexota bacterium]|nr:cell division FtsA domain-containing protein [Chloroflexota bacterium]